MTAEGNGHRIPVPGGTAREIIDLSNPAQPGQQYGQAVPPGFSANGHSGGQYDFTGLYGQPGAWDVTQVNQMTCAQAFRWYNTRGYIALPAHAAEKRLVLPAGYSFDRLPRLSEQDIAGFERAWQPGWRVALLMSKASRMTGIDADDMAQWEKFAAEHEVPPTIRQQTGREGGGLHLVYLRPDDEITEDYDGVLAGSYDGDLSQGAWSREYPGIEVKSKGILIAAPSLHPSGRKYQWLPGGPGEPAGISAPLLAARRQARISARREIAVAERQEQIEIERDARQRADAAGFRRGTAEEYPGTLADSLKRERPEQRLLIGGLWGVAHNLSIEALYKTGKTMLMDSAAGSLADGTPFLGFAPVHKPAGAVGMWNTEMDADDFDDYLSPHVTDTSRIAVAHLRWHPMNLLSSQAARDEAVRWLRWHGVTTWMIDSWTRLCAWCSIDPADNFAVPRLTAKIDEIKHEAGVTALAVTGHMPHQARTDRTKERGLGAQAYSGWVDCMWRYTRDEDGVRHLAAEGRRVALTECTVTMDGWGRLTAQAGDRDQTARGRQRQRITDALASAGADGIGAEDLKEAAGGNRPDAARLIRQMTAEGIIDVEKKGNAKIHRLRPTTAGASL
jgi:hypothetical protein